MTPDTQHIVETALPFIAAFMSYIIQQAHWSDRANTIVASITVILAAVGSLFVEHKLTGNPFADLLAIAALAVALQAEAFAPLQKWLRSNVVSTSSAESSNTPPQQVER